MMSENAYYIIAGMAMVIFSLMALSRWLTNEVEKTIEDGEYIPMRGDEFKREEKIHLKSKDVYRKHNRHR